MKECASSQSRSLLPYAPVNSCAESSSHGKDDRVFRLDRVNDAACAGMKR